MKIEENDQAYRTLKKSLGSLENKMRELYNLGYRAGFIDGRDSAQNDILEELIEIVKEEESNGRKDIN